MNKLVFDDKHYCERLSPYLALIRIPYLTVGGDTAFTNVYLVIDDELVLIDAGPWKLNTVDILSSSFAQLGFSLSDISKIIYTHAHPDHIGGGVQLSKGEWDFSNLIFYEAIEHVEKFSKFAEKIRSYFRDISIDYLSLHHQEKEWFLDVINTFWHEPEYGEIEIKHGLHDGEIIETGKLKFKVIFTPGHSPWDICLWEEEQGILFSGDFLMEKSTTLTGGLKGFGSDLISYESSLKKIKEYLSKGEFIFSSHGSPIEDGTKLVEYLSGVVKWREKKILDELSKGICSVVDLTRLFASVDNKLAFARQVCVTLTHLEKLEKEDNVLRLEDGREILFALKKE